MNFPGFCPSGTRFGWSSLECIPTAFSLPSLLEEKLSPLSEPPATSTSSSTVLTVAGLLLGMAAAAAIGVAAANATADKKEQTP